MSSNWQFSRIDGKVLLFLFPLAAVPVQHWISIFFLSISIAALRYSWMSYRSQHLSILEKYLFVAYGVYFIFYLISMLLHGAYDAWEVEIKYLLALPIYLYLRSVNNAQDSLIKGSIIGNYFIFISTVYEITTGHLYSGRAGGVYGPLFMGPMAVLTCFVALSSYRTLQTWAWKMAALLTLPITLYSMIGSESRSAYVAFCLLALYLLLTHLGTWRKKLSVMMFIILSMLSTFTFSPKFQQSALRVADNVQDIFVNKNMNYEELVKDHFDSGVERYLLWVAAIAIIKDHPITGIGYGHFQQMSQNYVDHGLFGNFKYRMGHGHSHNIFLEAYLVKGLLGFINLIAIFGLLLYLLYMKRQNDYNVYLTGVGVVLAIISFGMFEAAPINKNNFSAIFMIYVLTFVAALYHQAKENTKSNVIGNK